MSTGTHRRHRSRRRVLRRRLAALLALLVVVGAAVAVYAVREEPGWYVRMRYPLPYEQIVRGHAENYELDPALLAAVIYAESKFDPDAVSSAGAVGLMQLLPDTAQGIADRTGGGGYEQGDLVDPEINVRYGAWYLDHLRDKYGDHPEALDLALAAYNAGQTNVDRWVAAAPPGEPVDIRFPETRAYVDRVHHLAELYARGHGL
jgi:soluble lytic murein transglycosylase